MITGIAVCAAIKTAASHWSTITTAVSYWKTGNGVWNQYQEATKDYSPKFNQLAAHIDSTQKTVKGLHKIPSSIKGVLDKAFADYAKLVEGLGKLLRMTSELLEKSAKLLTPA